MLTNIISIGNSKGIRIPKALLELSGITDQIELKVKKGEIKVVPIIDTPNEVNDTMLLSQKALLTDWNTPEEEEAWKNLK